MPRILRTVLPRIRRSIAERGLFATLRRSALLPIHLVREYQAAKRLPLDGERSEFDLLHGVDTDGAVADWTYLSDLDISSPNWIQGNNYCAIDPERFSAVLSGLRLDFEDFTFIDFGSGKGRTLLMASDFPFRKVIGLEFSQELHLAAERNILAYKRSPQGCDAVESRCEDFVDFSLPPEPCVLYFFDPCSETLFGKLLDNIRKSLEQHPRLLWIIYVAPEKKKKLLDSAGFLLKAGWNEQYQFCWYRSSAGIPPATEET